MDCPHFSVEDGGAFGGLVSPQPVEWYTVSVITPSTAIQPPSAIGRVIVRPYLAVSHPHAGRSFYVLCLSRLKHRFNARCMQ